MRLVVADDSGLLREGMVRLLTEAGFDLVAQAGTADELLAAVEAHHTPASSVREPMSSLR